MQFTKLMYHNGNQGFVHMHKISPNFYFKITTEISKKQEIMNGMGMVYPHN